MLRYVLRIEDTTLFLNMIQMKCVRKYVYVYNVHNSTVVCRGGGGCLLGLFRGELKN